MDNLEVLAEMLVGLPSEKIQTLLGLMADQRPGIASFMITTGSTALVRDGEIKQERLTEANVCLSFVAAPTDPGLRARQLRAILDSGIYRGTLTERRINDELKELQQKPGVQSYLDNYPLECPRFYQHD